MRIGIFGGSFDPVHKGHINLVKELKKILHLNKVIVVPAFVSPFKTEKPPLARGHHRLEMLKLAFEGVSHIEISDIEIKRSDVSYTIDTIHELLDQYPYAELYLLLTDEALETFSRWRSFEEIQRLATVIYASKDTNKPPIIQIPWIDISATKIREKLLKGEASHDFLPSKVLDYIHEHHLYSAA